MNELFDVIIQPLYTYHGWMENGRVLVIRNKKYGIIDATGKLIIPLTYTTLGGGFYNGLLVASLDKKWGLIDSNNKTA